MIIVTTEIVISSVKSATNYNGSGDEACNRGTDERPAESH